MSNSRDVFNGTGIVSQSSLGIATFNSNKKDRTWNLGNLAIGEVMKLYPKRYTADVRIGRKSDMLRGDSETEGRYSCRIGVSSAGFSTEYQMPYGEIRPLHVGDLVLVGFLENNSNTPVILKVIHDISEGEGMANYRNILPNTFDPERDTDDITDYLNISPIQDFKKIDKFGNFEISSHTKSFIVGKEENFDDESFDYEDLSVKFPTDKRVISTQAHTDTQYDEPAVDLINSGAGEEVSTIHVNELNSKPKNYMAVFRDSFYDNVTSWLRFVINSNKNAFKMLQAKRYGASTSKSTDTSVSSSIDSGKMTVLDLEETGTLRIRRHLDTYKYKNADSKHFTDIQLNEDGSLVIETVNEYSSDTSVANPDALYNFPEYPRTIISIDGKTGEVKLTTSSKLKVLTNKGIDMRSNDDITMMSAKQISIMSKKGVLIGSEDQIGILSKEPITVQSQKIIGIDGAEGMSMTSQQSIQMAGGNDIAITSNGGTIGLASTKAVKTMSADIEMTGAIKQMGSVRTTGAQTNYGSVKSFGALTHNGRSPTVDGDRDDNGDRNFSMFCNVLISMVEAFVVEQAVSLVMKHLPGVAALVSTVAKAFSYYQPYQSGVKSINALAGNLEGMEFDSMAKGMSRIAVGVMISNESPFKAGLDEFIEVANAESKKSKTLGMFSKTSQLGKLANSLETAGESRNELAKTMEGELDLEEKHGFATVKSPFEGLDELGIMTDSLESEDSLITQMKYLTSTIVKTDDDGNAILDEDGNPITYGLGLNLTKYITADMSTPVGALTGTIQGVEGFWNDFSQPNDLVKMVNFVCSEEYASTHKRYITNDDGSVLVLQEKTPTSTSTSVTKYRNVTYDLTNNEKAAIRMALSTVHTDYNISKFTDENLSRWHKFADGHSEHLYGTNIGSGYMNELADLLPISGWKQEGDVEVKIEKNNYSSGGSTYNVKSTKTYSIIDVLNQLDRFIYPNGWKVIASQVEQQIDATLGTNCSRYLNSNTFYDSSYIAQYAADNPALIDFFSRIITPDPIDTRDHFIDVVVKRYLWENACQAIAQLNYAWKTHECRKDAWKIIDTETSENPVTTYDTSIFTYPDMVSRVDYANSSGTPEALQGFGNKTSVDTDSAVTDSGTP